MKRFAGVFLAVVLFAPAFAAAAARPALADGLPSITVGDSSVWEGDAGSLVVSVPVDLSFPSSTPVSVDYAIVSDSALAGSDFGARHGTLKFPANKASKAITVQVYGDTQIELDEHLNITLSTPVGATLAKATGGVTILDDDADGVGPGIEVNIGDVTVVEADGGKHVATLPVTLSRPSTTSYVGVEYTLDCGTASQGSDYTEKPHGSLLFKPGQQTRNISFAVLANSTPEEISKSLLDSIKVVSGPAVVSEVAGEATIVDDDGGSPPPPGTVTQVSVNNDGMEGETPQATCGNPTHAWGSMHEAMSKDGRYIAFDSDADNLVPGDNNLATDVFVHDTVANTTERVDVATDGSELPYGARLPSISADGRYVTFQSEYGTQLWLRDRVAHTTELISATPSGQMSNGDGMAGSISADGRYVAFASFATDLVSPPPPANHAGLYLRDRVLGVTRLLSVYGQDAPNHASDWYGPSMSADGRYIVFNDSNSSLVPGDTNGCTDTFVYDTTTDTVERVSVASDGSQQVSTAAAGADCSYFHPIISSDGRYVGFSSTAYNIGGVAGPESALHAYVHDRQTGTTTRVDDPAINTNDIESMMLGMSDDARYVAWSCFCGDPIANDGVPDQVTMWTDRATGVSTQVGLHADGTSPIDEHDGWFTYTVAWGGLSADGSVVAFDSRATNMVPGDDNGTYDVFTEQMT